MRGLICTVAVLAVAAPASASQLIDRVHTAELKVNARGEALVSYEARGRTWNVLAWGAINARHPSEHVPQVRFRKDYSGNRARGFRNTCGPYDGPQLAFFVAGCKAPDGSYWALQSWRVPLPDLGIPPWLPLHRRYELHLSHWRGPIGKLEAWTDWVYSGRFHEVFGRMTYLGQPVHGFTATRQGAPTDTYGRLVYLDTYNSRYGKGWKRENSFLLHNPAGIFCYGFFTFDPMRYPHPPGFPKEFRGPGTGEKYRLTVEGPGVTPDVSITIPGLHDYNPNDSTDAEYERQQNAILDSIKGPDKLCRH